MKVSNLVLEVILEVIYLLVASLIMGLILGLFLEMAAMRQIQMKTADFIFTGITVSILSLGIRILLVIIEENLKELRGKITEYKP